jgi:hypothetical protein
MRFTIIFGLAILIPLSAKDKKPKSPRHKIRLKWSLTSPTTGPVLRFLATEHYSSHYLYAEHGAGASVTLIDLTRPSQPAVLAEVAYPSAGPDSLVVVSGTAALVTTGGSPHSGTPQTIRVFDFSDPHNPKVAHEFNLVTAIDRDDRRGLIFLANADSPPKPR